MGLNYYASSPTLVLPPQHPPPHLMHQPHGEVAMTDNCTAQQATARRFVAKMPTPPSLNYLAKSCHSTAGRKRSRADIGEDFEDQLDQPMVEALRPIAEPSSGFEQGQDQINAASMPLEGAQEDVSAANRTATPDRPRLVARKSQRRASESTLTSQLDNEEVDPIVRKLGIGWKRISDNDCPATAGQQAFIRNQFSFHEPRILLQHDGLGILVVQTKPASAQGYWDQWWLFTEDLKSCRFLCHDEADLFRRLDNKKQDERGTWQPDILAEGPIIRAKDAAPIAEEPEIFVAVASSLPSSVNGEPTASIEEDVEMRM